MQVAKIENGEIVQVGHHREIFPNTSFPEAGPTDSFLTAHGAVKVSMWLDHDQETEVLESTTPYLLDGKAYLVKVVALTEEAVSQRIAAEQALTSTRLKAERDLTVSRIVVTVASGKQFDGDETSQNRMARAILALEATGTATTDWKLADNTTVAVSIAELKEALALAGAAQTAVWMV